MIDKDEAERIVERAIARRIPPPADAPRKIGVLYGCSKKLTNAHKLVSFHATDRDKFGCQPPYYVRLKVINWKARMKSLQGEFGLVEALDNADPPMEGETLLNTVYVD
jgi:hypothetical protein